jgi:hypothetical protein
MAPVVLGYERTVPTGLYQRMAKLYRDEIEAARLAEIVAQYQQRYRRFLDHPDLRSIIQDDFEAGRILVVQSVTVSETEVGYAISRSLPSPENVTPNG